jgi:putative ABC transport system ATP-binding protein
MENALISPDQVGVELFRSVKSLLRNIIQQDSSFLRVAIVYGLGISLLTLAVPISVQMLINSVANTASINAVTVLSLVLFGLLVISGVLVAFQGYALELFERRFYARMVSEFTLRSIYADHNVFKNMNRYELINRYFDIMSVQKVLPSLVTGMFSLILQMMVGLILVSFYHLWFLLFNLAFVVAIWAIWRIWGYASMRSAIDVSDAKYKTARHLEDVAIANSFFKIQHHIAHAIKKSDSLTREYIGERKVHFLNTFSQQISFLFLYAIASAGLLGIGGALVIKGEVSLGQLVASELILSAVFYGISRLGYYLVQCYDLSAAIEELSRIYAIPLEKLSSKQTMEEKPCSVAFDKIVYEKNGYNTIKLNFAIEPGKKILAGTNSYATQLFIGDLLKNYITPEKGFFCINSHDISEIELPHLRGRIIILDRPSVVECSVLEYLTMNAPDASMAQVRAVLEVVELENVINALENKMDSMLINSGEPLNYSETLRLKLASALLSKPSMLVLNELFDVISYLKRQRIFTRICKEYNLTLLYFSNRKDLDMFDQYLFVDHQKQEYVESLEALRSYEVNHEK